MHDVLEQTDVYRGEYQTLRARAAGNGWAWYADRRDAAMQRFNHLGFPHSKLEAWRFTDVRPIAQTTFRVPHTPSDRPKYETIAQLAFGGIARHRLVCVDGRFRPDLSTLDKLPRGVTVCSLAEAAHEHADLLRRHLGQYADDENNAFTVLNGAFLEDGGFVHIDREVVIDEPIYLLLFSCCSDQPQMTHPRNVILAEPGSRATVIENSVSNCSHGGYFTNAVTECHVAETAQLHHYLLQRESEAAYNISSLYVRQERESRFDSHTILLGAKLCRNEVHVTLAGERCESLINGLYLPHDQQHMDNHMRVNHAAPNCDSRQFYRGILTDQASAVFCGRIVVDRPAQKTDAKQSNANLLLSDDAKVDTMPQLEIFADDVKCTHGATSGEIDEEALFYLMARGIPEDAARGMLIYAFAHEAIDRMSVDAIRAPLENLLIARFPQLRLLADTL